MHVVVVRSLFPCFVVSLPSSEVLAGIGPPMPSRSDRGRCCHLKVPTEPVLPVVWCTMNDLERVKLQSATRFRRHQRYWYIQVSIRLGDSLVDKPEVNPRSNGVSLYERPITCHLCSSSRFRSCSIALHSIRAGPTSRLNLREIAG